MSLCRPSLLLCARAARPAALGLRRSQAGSRQYRRRRRLRFRLRIPVGHIGPCYLPRGGRMKLAQPDPDGRFSLVPVIEPDVPCLGNTSTWSYASIPVLHAKTSFSHRYLKFVTGVERVARMWFPVSWRFERFLVEWLGMGRAVPTKEPLACHYRTASPRERIRVDGAVYGTRASFDSSGWVDSLGSPSGAGMIKPAYTMLSLFERSAQ